MLSELFAFQGTTDYGAGIAQKKAVSVAVSQQATAGGAAVVVGGVRSAQSPDVGQQGKVVQTPQGMGPASTFHVGWDTDGVSDDIVKAIIFDAKGNAVAAGIEDDGITSAGTLYSQTNNTRGIAKYDALQSRLCNATYTIGTLRIHIKKSANATVEPSLDDVDIEISWVDENFDKQTKTIHLRNHSSADSYHRDIINLALTDAAMLLDQSTVVKAIGPKDSIISFTWVVNTRSN